MARASSNLSSEEYRQHFLMKRGDWLPLGWWLWTSWPWPTRPPSSPTFQLTVPNHQNRSTNMAVQHFADRLSNGLYSIIIICFSVVTKWASRIAQERFDISHPILHGQFFRSPVQQAVSSVSQQLEIEYFRLWRRSKHHKNGDCLTERKLLVYSPVLPTQWLRMTLQLNHVCSDF